MNNEQWSFGLRDLTRILDRAIQGDRFVQGVVIFALVGVVLFVARFPMAGRIIGVRYDILYWDEIGNGHILSWFALGGYLVAATGTIGSLFTLVRALFGRPGLWLSLACLPLVMLPAVGVRRQPTIKDFPKVTKAGNLIVSALEDYHANTGYYPSRLSQLAPGYLPSIPNAGLVRHRPFYYAKRGDNSLQPGPWFPWPKHALKMMGNDPYVIAVPFVPVGTVLYRPSGQYRNVRGRPIGHGWAISPID